MARATPTPDVLDPADPVRRLHERPCGVELVEVLVITALQVHHRSIARSGDLDHRKAVRGGVGQCGQAVEEVRARCRQADAGAPGEESGGGGGVAGGGLLPETDVADPGRLRDAGEVGDRDADDPVDGVDVVGLEGVHDQVEAVGQRGRVMCRLLGCVCVCAITVVRVPRRCPRPSRYAAIHADYQPRPAPCCPLDSYRLSIVS